MRKVERLGRSGNALVWRLVAAVSLPARMAPMHRNMIAPPWNPQAVTFISFVAFISNMGYGPP